MFSKYEPFKREERGERREERGDRGEETGEGEGILVLIEVQGKVKVLQGKDGYCYQAVSKDEMIKYEYLSFLFISFLFVSSYSYVYFSFPLIFFLYLIK